MHKKVDLTSRWSSSRRRPWASAGGETAHFSTTDTVRAGVCAPKHNVNAKPRVERRERTTFAKISTRAGNLHDVLSHEPIGEELTDAHSCSSEEVGPPANMRLLLDSRDEIYIWTMNRWAPASAQPAEDTPRRAAFLSAPVPCTVARKSKTITKCETLLRTSRQIYILGNIFTISWNTVTRGNTFIEDILKNKLTRRKTLSL